MTSQALGFLVTVWVIIFAVAGISINALIKGEQEKNK
ncbi:hypothetical protein JWYL7_1523 [Alkalithermobacter thermoalcaliphilus JW-YL-7 = DSM 7308]|uniref:Uncharacterized protein n=1 Tax=Alkalithermobacter thermoalcaliphilus JW-YL-7 = DSM 7308 TaxID=1121328 RepID=A0A150FS86_CLOPD|nr:hypothetical protein JWYL7_1523 [[Clostridium] paradoxum JW-YL-7 = DSM 7308]